jgi:predicted metalloprotease
MNLLFYLLNTKWAWQQGGVARLAKTGDEKRTELIWRNIAACNRPFIPDVSHSQLIIVNGNENNYFAKRIEPD